MYANGENPTISRYEKIIYDMQGRAHRDLYTANHKISSSFLGFAIDQQVSYLLGNGINFEKSETKKKLGKLFDEKVAETAENAQKGGVAFAFWNFDHLDVFPLTEFVPLYDEETGALMAGIRFWQVSEQKPLRATLYELEGYTEYIKRVGEQMTVLAERRTYRQIVARSIADGTTIMDGENYPGLPIVPLKNNKSCKATIAGKRNTLDALDLVVSNMVNNVDEGNLIYWVLTNCDGMDDLDDVKFLDRLRTTHVAHANGDDGARAEAHTIDAPYAGTQAAIDTLTKKLYTDFQAFDSSAVSAGNQTATAIKACYVPLDLKTDKFERQVTEFIQGVLELAGIDDTPTYTRNKIINAQEETQTVLLGAQYFDGEYITKKLLTILGDADRAEEVIRRKDAGDLERLTEGE